MSINTISLYDMDTRKTQNYDILSISEYPIGIGAYGTVFSAVLQDVFGEQLHVAIKKLSSKYGQSYISTIGDKYIIAKSYQFQTFDYLKMGEYGNECFVTVTPNLSTEHQLCISLNNHSNDRLKCAAVGRDCTLINKTKEAIALIFQRASEHGFFVGQANSQFHICDSLFLLLDIQKQDIQLILGDFDTFELFAGDYNELYDLNFSLFNDSVSELKKILKCK